MQFFKGMDSNHWCKELKVLCNNKQIETSKQNFKINVYLKNSKSKECKLIKWSFYYNILDNKFSYVIIN